MPISIVSRIKGKSRGLGSGLYPSYDPAAGTQACKKELRITLASTVRLDPSVFDVVGVFTIFTYDTFYTSGGQTPQQHFNTYVTVDDSLLTRVQLEPGIGRAATVDTVNKKITINLVPRS